MIPKKVVITVFERDEYKCQQHKCRREYPEDNHALHCHHVKRKGQGGKDIPDNLITLCWECHTKIHNGSIKMKKKKTPPRSAHMTYEQEKKIIAETSKSHEEYQERIFKLAKRLKI